MINFYKDCSAVLIIFTIQILPSKNFRFFSDKFYPQKRQRAPQTGTDTYRPELAWTFTAQGRSVLVPLTFSI